ncbi:MAG: ribosomal subunit interface protein [Candidatus Yanofskybacteria bacterium RIFCSPHIGHO2_02_FULL_41_29]|uniref:Ribosomal subunit interface protein n=1 Tax=Candidatus Yanofskybacteria bacterium RIFCSPHIGHO2_01_FULL_41_53 TaxID=1802663 RepID=A0A1F8EH58_9BACT|nr:MAG: ribosomal subunit interface protein [Candidatus Yanofskybacteria bacterium RIFCSPHIGHO2_01_FULL_41_53]OGN11220.1 MAG: ribosomal subunit interface protein [Candidatus Yanofskybacteria bacterium RIFCSPHIGHO2_02_FULL_41_29]OGN16967.1 MAG: ribosomal subunit interface protein [Candidatus Yanofskybacteria bacterium RIFCSPHIGHO2_12_FULL_41_9]OGN22286.1 MAG: ribosomal subunit interface protein [Candidatus Yanofskybacteria bacterium RIFCSPLOWO2_01_FULL_41_67]OGN29654.1 MAG: ribosomal subunit int
MKIDLYGKNIQLDEPLRVFVEERIGGLQKFIDGGPSRLRQGFGEPMEARVEIGLPSKHHRSGRIYYAEVNLKIGGKLLRATCQHEDMRNAIVDAKNELQRQIKKFKEKKKDLSRAPKV